MFALSDVGSCICFGLLMALVLIGIVGLLGFALFAPFKYNWIIWVAFLLFFVFIGYHSVLLIGGLYVRSYIIDTAEMGMSAVTALDSTLSSNVFWDGFREIYISEVNSSITSVLDLIALSLDSIDKYLWRRVGWILFALIVSVGLFACLSKPSKHANIKHERRQIHRISRRQKHLSHRYRIGAL